MSHKQGSEARIGPSTNQAEADSTQNLDPVEEKRITIKRERAKKSLKYQETLLEALTESVLDGILIVSPEGQILHFNQRFLDIWNFPADVRESKSDEAALRWAARQTSNPAAFLARVKAIYEDSDQEVREELLMKDGRVYERFGAPIQSGDTRHGWVWTFRNITERKRQELDAQFLGDLSRATQALIDPDEIMAATARMLGEHLGVNRCAYAEVEADEDHFTITGDYTRDTFSIVGHYAMSAFGAEVLRLMRADEPYVVDDVDSDPRVGEADLAAYRQTDIGAVICLPLHKGERFAAAMAVHQKTPRRWTPAEIELVQTVVARCWEALERARARRNLGESEGRYRALVEAGDAAVWRTDPAGRLIWANEAFERLSGLTLESAQGEGWQAVIHPEHRLQAVEAWQHAVATITPYDVEHRVRGPNGQYRWVHSRAVPVFAKDGIVREWVGADTDITVRKEALEALAASEAKYATAFRAGPMVLVLTRLKDGRFWEVNERFLSVTGYRREEVLGKSPVELGLWLEPEKRLQGLEQLKRGQPVRSLETQFRMKDRSIRTFLTAADLVDIGGETCVHTALVDITDRKQAEGEREHLLAELNRFNETLEQRVRERTQQVQALAGELTLAEAREQARLAQVLHDDLQQQLFTIQFALREVQKRVEGDVEALAKLEAVSELVKAAILITRRTTANLSPAVLPGEGLIEALYWLRRDMKERYGFEVRIEAVVAPSIPTEAVRVLLFNLVRELLFNVVKHAEVKETSIALAGDEQALRITVTDLGKGFDPALLEQVGHGTGLGLSGVHKRLQLFGGHLEIDSAPRQGTRITIVLPVSSLSLR